MNATTATRPRRSTALRNLRGAYKAVADTLAFIELAEKLNSEEHIDRFRRELAEWEADLEDCIEQAILAGIDPDKV